MGPMRGLMQHASDESVGAATQSREAQTQLGRLLAELVRAKICPGKRGAEQPPGRSALGWCITLNVLCASEHKQAEKLWLAQRIRARLVAEANPFLLPSLYASQACLGNRPRMLAPVTPLHLLRPWPCLLGADLLAHTCWAAAQQVGSVPQGASGAARVGRAWLLRRIPGDGRARPGAVHHPLDPGAMLAGRGRRRGAGVPGHGGLPQQAAQQRGVPEHPLGLPLESGLPAGQQPVHDGCDVLPHLAAKSAPGGICGRGGEGQGRAVRQPAHPPNAGVRVSRSCGSIISHFPHTLLQALTLGHACMLPCPQ